jgi:hypothetical protein
MPPVKFVRRGVSNFTNTIERNFDIADQAFNSDASIRNRIASRRVRIGHNEHRRTHNRNDGIAGGEENETEDDKHRGGNNLCRQII